MPGPNRKTTILVIDDSPDFQLLVKTLLQEEDFQFILVVDAITATDLANRKHPQLIILDIGVPGGDGLMLPDRLKANTRTNDIPILIITGRTNPALTTETKATGAAAFLTKPIDKKALLDTVTTILTQCAT